MVRLLRRGWRQRQDLEARRNTISSTGFDPDSDTIKVANKIVSQFARDAREQGLVPVIYVVNSRGYSDFMFRALEKTLRSENIPYVSTFDFADSGDPRNYLPDAHFVDEKDREFAGELERVVAGQLDGKSASD